MDPGITAMSSATLATGKAQMDHRGVKAASLANVPSKGAQVDLGNAAGILLHFWRPGRHKRTLEMPKQCPQRFRSLRGYRWTQE
jgi:hypothetical protein